MTRTAKSTAMLKAGFALAKREIALLSAVLIVAGGVLAFLRIADEMGEGRLAAFDRWLLLGLRNPADLADPLGPQWLEQTALQITALGSTTVLSIITFIAIIWLALLRERAGALLVAVSVIGGAGLSNLLKIAFARGRPDLVPPIELANGFSFPSGHAFSAAVVYLTLGALLARLRPERSLKIFLLSVAIALTLAIGITRVYLGVHWPSDVLAGWSVGAAWAMGCWIVALWLQRRAKS